MNYQLYMSKRVKGLKASAIREMFKLMSDPEIISLAGGSPAPELFPGAQLGEIAKDILTNNTTRALQYGTTDGYGPLKDIICKRVQKINSISPDDKVIVTTGAQQGIDLAIKVLVDDDEKVVVEEPSFVGTLNSFRSHRASFVGVPLEDDGMNMEKLEEALKNNKVKLIYTIPTFQNPSGITMSAAKRKRLLELAKKYDALVLEDNPYGDLRFAGEDIPTIKSIDNEGRVLYVGSFSKILSPGMRLGYVVGPAELIDKIEVTKQANDVHTPLITQMMAAEFMTKYDIDKVVVEPGRKLYGEKCNFMLDCLEKYCKGLITWTKPEGGLFIMCTAPDGVNSGDVLAEALKKKVAFVAGNSFMVNQDAPSPMFRLNYSTMPTDRIEKGIIALSEALKKFIK